MFSLDKYHPFYRPLWRRILVTGVTAVWAGIEIFVSQSGFWGALAGGIAGYLAWELLITWKEPAE